MYLTLYIYRYKIMIYNAPLGLIVNGLKMVDLASTLVFCRWLYPYTWYMMKINLVHTTKEVSPCHCDHLSVNILCQHFSLKVFQLSSNFKYNGNDIARNYPSTSWIMEFNCQENRGNHIPKKKKMLRNILSSNPNMYKIL